VRDVGRADLATGVPPYLLGDADIAAGPIDRREDLVEKRGE
jgi:hypothetical protein